MVNKTLTILALIANTAIGQISIEKTIQLNGYENSIRTVHFSSDEQFVYGDFTDLIKWSITSQKVIFTTPIPGYSTHKSSFDGDSLWFAANSNYNSDKKDITDMHHNLNLWRGVEMISKKMASGFQAGALIPNSNKAVVIGTNAKYQYKVSVIDLTSGKESNVLFSEGKDGSAVPTAIKVSANGKYVGVSFAGEGAGMRAYNLSDGKELSFTASKIDANEVAISGNNSSIYFNSGPTLVAVDSENWEITKKWDLADNISSLDVDTTGRYVALAYENKGAVLFDTKTGTVLQELTESRVFDVTFSPTGKYIGLGLQKTIQSDQAPSVLIFEISGF